MMQLDKDHNIRRMSDKQNVSVLIKDDCRTLEKNDLFNIWNTIRLIHDHIKSDAVVYYCKYICQSAKISGYNVINIDYDIFNRSYTVDAALPGLHSIDVDITFEPGEV